MTIEGSLRKTVLRGLRSIAETDDEARPRALSAVFASDVMWHGCHPFGDLLGLDALNMRFWKPLAEAMPDLARRDLVFIAGRFGVEDWISATGYYEATFTRSWLGIPPTGRWAQLRFGEVYRLHEGKIAEVFVLLDLVDLMRQAGAAPWRQGKGLEMMMPGPAAQDGVRLEEARTAETNETLDLVLAMLGRLFEDDRASMGMEQFWSPRMMWYGPALIGATRGLDGFFRDHQEPWMRAFPDWEDALQSPHFADGPYACYAGWPSIKATQTGELLGLAPTGRKVDIRVMDWWRREGLLLAENWVLIDFPHLFDQLGVDLLGSTQERFAGPLAG